MIQNYDYEVQTSYTLYLFFIFSLCLFHVTDLIKNWNYVYWLLLFLIRLNLGTPKLLCPKSVYDVENSLHQSLPTNINLHIFLTPFSSYTQTIYTQYSPTGQKQIRTKGIISDREVPNIMNEDPHNLAVVSINYRYIHTYIHSLHMHFYNIPYFKLSASELAKKYGGIKCLCSSLTYWQFSSVFDKFFQLRIVRYR